MCKSRGAAPLAVRALAGWTAAHALLARIVLAPPLARGKAGARVALPYTQRRTKAPPRRANLCAPTQRRLSPLSFKAAPAHLLPCVALPHPHDHGRCRYVRGLGVKERDLGGAGGVGKSACAGRVNAATQRGSNRGRPIFSRSPGAHIPLTCTRTHARPPLTQ